jgi:hypothetical protein
LTSVCIPRSVTTIGHDCFAGCKQLALLTFETESKLCKIGSDAFDNCFALKSISIPPSVRGYSRSSRSRVHSLRSTFESNAPLCFDSSSEVGSSVLILIVLLAPGTAFCACLAVQFLLVQVSIICLEL